jgi:SAM-dependent methyltransferase
LKNGRVRAKFRIMARTVSDPARRFSDRVDDYVRYRPHYPPGVLDRLREGVGLTPAAVIADIGAGTGISTELFLRNGNPVFAVEPNREMRAAAERILGDCPGFHSVDGTAEATTLPAASLDGVVAAQAFHWFDPGKARDEFRRILRPGGWVALMWNRRRKYTTPFSRAYEALLETYGVDYAQVRHERIDAAELDRFFLPGYQLRTLPNQQSLDFDALKGRLLSSSYTPTEAQESYAPMIKALQDIFQEHQQGGHVRFDYETQIYFGQV